LPDAVVQYSGSKKSEEQKGFRKKNDSEYNASF
jgi:hypothetical protein